MTPVFLSMAIALAAGGWYARRGGQRPDSCRSRSRGCKQNGRPPLPRRRPFQNRIGYLRCLLTSLVISNIETCFLPPNTSFSFSSALMLRRFLLSWSPFFLMYIQIFLVTSVRGIGLFPITAPRD